MVIITEKFMIVNQVDNYQLSIALSRQLQQPRL